MVEKNPSGLDCVIINGTGVVNSANAANLPNIEINCIPSPTPGHVNVVAQFVTPDGEILNWHKDLRFYGNDLNWASTKGYVSFYPNVQTGDRLELFLHSHVCSYNIFQQTADCNFIAHPGFNSRLLSFTGFLCQADQEVYHPDRCTNLTLIEGVILD